MAAVLNKLNPGSAGEPPNFAGNPSDHNFSGLRLSIMQLRALKGPKTMLGGKARVAGSQLLLPAATAAVALAAAAACAAASLYMLPGLVLLLLPPAAAGVAAAAASVFAAGVA